MALQLASVTHSRDNNFNLIRFIAAAMVLVSHSFALRTGLEVNEPLYRLGMSLGGVAVDVFFVTSGFLITGSLLNRRGLVAFVWARILRIYPALIVAVLFTVVVVGWYFTDLQAAEYFARPEIFKYVWKNATLVLGGYEGLPGVFLRSPFPSAVNGSLWTLPWEVRMYAILLSLGIVIRVTKLDGPTALRRAVVLLGVVSLAGHIVNHYLVLSTAIRLTLMLRLAAMFFIGASLYLLKERVLVSRRVMVAMLCMLLLATTSRDLFYLCYHLFIGYLVIGAAYLPSQRLHGFNKWGDYSYGMYLYAFPIQQSVVALVPGISAVQYVMDSFVITFCLAFLSWHLIEKRSLKFKDSVAVREGKLSLLQGGRAASPKPAA